MSWQPSYELAAVQRFLADAEVERASLRQQIDAARARAERARRAFAARAAVQADLAERVLAAEREAQTVDREHRRAIEAIGTVAAEEVNRILAATHQQADVMRAAVRATAPRATPSEWDSYSPPTAPRHDR